ncbi:hypothetical protein BC941DRAFT_441149 [Chlamydoabsidia padenii]|nr:hypothetical protein BC941DRAFT_441149 [Chlamydoabsidia padenii]
MQDCCDVLHFLFDNNPGSTLYSSKNIMQQHMCIGTATSFFGPYASLLSRRITIPTASAFETLVQKFLQALTSKSVVIGRMPQFLFFSDPIHPKKEIDYPHSFFHENILYLMCDRICSSSLDGMHFWSYYLNYNGTVTKVDNILHTAKVCGLSLYGKMKNTVMTIHTRYIPSHRTSRHLTLLFWSPLLFFSILLLLPIFLPLFLRFLLLWFPILLLLPLLCFLLLWFSILLLLLLFLPLFLLLLILLTSIRLL